MRALILLGAFYFVQGSGDAPPVHYVSLPVEQGPDASLVLVVDEISVSGIRIHAEVTNSTRSGVTIIPNPKPPGHRWWSPWMSIKVTTMPTATSNAAYIDDMPAHTMPCVIPRLSSQSDIPKPAAPVFVEAAETKSISTATIPLPEGDDVVVLQAIYRTYDREPTCPGFSSDWLGATKLNMRSNYIVVHRSAGSSAK